MALLIEAISGSIKLVFTVATIVIPLLTFLEVLKDTPFLSRFSTILEPVVSVFKLPKEAALPLVVGIIFGIAYGAGVIIQSAKEGKLNRRDFMLVFLFLAINHGIIEDTLLFSRIGAKGWLLVLIRFFIASAFVFALAAVLENRASKNNLSEPGSQ